MATPPDPDPATVDEPLDPAGEAYARLAPLRRRVSTMDGIRRSAGLVADQLRSRAAAGGWAPAAGGRSPESSHAQAVRLADELAALGRRLTAGIEQVERELADGYHGARAQWRTQS